MAEQHVETLNMIELPISEIIKRIRINIEHGFYDPVIMLGKMGMGKTESLKNLAKDLGIGYCELRLVNMTETDMLGIPTITTDGKTTYASNELLPTEKDNGEVGILAIDEITSCSRTMRAAAYQLLDGQRKLGNYTLPDKWICVGLGNGPDDGGVFTGAEAALFTRAMCFRVAVSPEAWKDWAVKNDINASVMAYLAFSPASLHVFDPNEMQGICPTPRTWVKLSKLLDIHENLKGGYLDTREVTILAASSIGVKESGTFSGFYKYNSSKDIINVADIVAGKLNGKVAGKSESQVLLLAIENLGKEVKRITKDDIGLQKKDRAEIDTLKKVANVFKWITELGEVRLDWAVSAIRNITHMCDEMIAISIDDRFDELCPEFEKFCKAHKVIADNT